MKQLDGCELVLLAYLFRENLATAFVDAVCACVVFRSDHSVGATVYELDRTIAVDSDADASGSADHVWEVFPPRNS